MRALLIISVIFAVTSLTARAGVTYTITSYPGGLADLPCDAFEKNDDGSWTQVAILVGGVPLFRPAIVSKTLPRRASSRRSATTSSSVRAGRLHLGPVWAHPAACPPEYH